MEADLGANHKSVDIIDDLQICPHSLKRCFRPQSTHCNMCSAALNSTTALDSRYDWHRRSHPGYCIGGSAMNNTEKSGATLCRGSTGRSRSYSNTLVSLERFPADPSHRSPSHEDSPRGDRCRSRAAEWIQTRRCP